MKESQGIIQRVRHLGGEYQQLELAVADYLGDMKPGQCLLARSKQMRTRHEWNPYLRSVWYPFYANRGKVTVEVKSPDPYHPGDVFDLIAPVGQAFRFRNTLRNVLLVAYHTPPFALLMTIPQLLGHQVSVTLALLGDAVDYPTNHLPPEVEVILGDNSADPLSWQGQVTTIGWADQVFVVVPPSDELAYFSQVWRVFNERRAEISKNYLFGVFQSVTPCGVGACDACLVRTKDGVQQACIEGPAFDLSQILF